MYLKIDKISLALLYKTEVLGDDLVFFIYLNEKKKGIGLIL